MFWTNSPFPGPAEILIQAAPAALLTDRRDVLRLVGRIAERDRNAFTVLYDALAPPLLDRLRAVVPVAAGPEAILAATFVEVWSLARFHTAPGTDVYAWVDTIAARRLTDRQCDRGPDAADGSAVTARRHLWWAAVADSYDRQIRLSLAALLDRPAGTGACVDGYPLSAPRPRRPGPDR